MKGLNLISRAWLSLLVLSLLVTKINSDSSTHTKFTQHETETKQLHVSIKDNKKFNFALNTAGAVVLDKSPVSGKGYSNLLNNDQDEYAIAPCNEEKWVVIGLSEDIVVSEVVIANYEKYSSKLKDFNMSIATVFPSEHWKDLGKYTAQPLLGEQSFEVEKPTAHSRYLKIHFLTHYDNDQLCTISQIKVHGTTVIASLTQELQLTSSLTKDFRTQFSISDILKEDEQNEKLNKTEEIFDIPESMNISVVNDDIKSNHVVSSDNNSLVNHPVSVNVVENDIGYEVVNTTEPSNIPIEIDITGDVDLNDTDDAVSIETSGGATKSESTFESISKIKILSPSHDRDETDALTFPNNISSNLYSNDSTRQSNRPDSIRKDMIVSKPPKLSEEIKNSSQCKNESLETNGNDVGIFIATEPSRRDNTSSIQLESDHNISLVNENITISNDTDRNTPSINLSTNNTANISDPAVRNSLVMTQTNSTINITEAINNSKPAPFKTPKSFNITHCRDLLKYEDFHAKILLKLQQVETDIGASSQDNVIKQLFLRIRTMELNYAISEMYTSQMSDCFRGLLSEISDKGSDDFNGFNSKSSDYAIKSESVYLTKTLAKLFSREITLNDVLFLLAMSWLASCLSVIFSAIILIVYIRKDL